MIPLYMEFATASAFGSLLPCREQDSLKYWEINADNRSKAGWSWGCVSALDAHGPHGASAVLDAPYEVLADRTLSRAPDCMSQFGCDSYAGCEHPSRRPAEGSATAVPDDALGNRHRYVFVSC